MTRPPITSKQDMFRRLDAGEFGNSAKSWRSLAEWEADPSTRAFPLWGIRSRLKTADARTKLNVPSADVPAFLRAHYPDGGADVTAMLDDITVLKAEVCESDLYPVGLCLDYPTAIVPGDEWRGSFREFRKREFGLTALMTLKRHLWPQDLENLRRLLDEYPLHKIEMTVCSRAVGRLPNSNTVVWEIRPDGGGYENW